MQSSHRVEHPLALDNRTHMPLRVPNGWLRAHAARTMAVLSVAAEDKRVW
jgi:hypothetical protein